MVGFVSVSRVDDMASKYSYAVICSSNQNRSMAAHCALKCAACCTGRWRFERLDDRGDSDVHEHGDDSRDSRQSGDCFSMIQTILVIVMILVVVMMMSTILAMVMVSTILAMMMVLTILVMVMVSTILVRVMIVMMATTIAFKSGTDVWVCREAHFRVRSFGAGAQVRMPAAPPNVSHAYDFGVPYAEIHRELSSVGGTTFYEDMGLLAILERNMRIKEAPERFQDNSDRFNVIITSEERVFDLVVEHLQESSSHSGDSVHVINVETQDVPTEAVKAADDIVVLCKVIACWCWQFCGWCSSLVRR